MFREKRGINYHALTALEVEYRCTTGPYTNLQWHSTKGAATLYDILVDEILDVVEITGLSNCVVMVTVRELLPDLWL